MTVDNLSQEQLANIFTYFVFWHGDVVQTYGNTLARLDNELYQKVYDQVAKNLRKIKRNHKFVKQCANADQFYKRLKKVSPSRQTELQKYSSEMTFYSTWDFEISWKAPLVIDKPQTTDLAQYLLEGAFYKACIDHEVWNKHVADIINRDVFNRVYSLVCQGLIG